MLQVSTKGVKYTWSTLMKKQVHVNMQLLYQCNFRCNICDFWQKEYKNTPRLSLSQVEELSAKLAQLGPQVISIGGGEPLLHADIIPIVKALAKHHFPVMICNGWYVTDEIAKALFEAGMMEISVSVDYADAERHDAQRGIKGAYERALNALRTLQRNRTESHQRVHMISVIMNDNLLEVEPLIHLAEELGVTYLVTLYSDKRGKKDKQTVHKDTSAHLLSLHKKYKSFVTLPGYIEKFSEAQNNNGIGGCYAGKNLMNIDSSGDVNLCIDFLDDPVGNIFTDDIHQLRDKLLQRHRENECQGCWTSCRGSIETLMYGKHRVKNYKGLMRMIKDVPLVRE